MGNLMEREKKGELSDTIMRKQPTDDLIDLALTLERAAIEQYDAAKDRAARIMSIAHDLAEERREHMGRDGI